MNYFSFHRITVPAAELLARHRAQWFPANPLSHGQLGCVIPHDLPDELVSCVVRGEVCIRLNDEPPYPGEDC